MGPLRFLRRQARLSCIYNENQFKFRRRDFLQRRFQQTIGKHLGSLKPKDASSDYHLESAKPSSFEIVRGLARHLWPDETDTKKRVIACGCLIVAGKGVNVAVPFIFKHIVDMLNADPGQCVSASLITACVLGYGLARMSTSGFRELQNALFAKVTQTGIRKNAQEVFLKLHQLDLKFHLEKETGALSRILDRGTRGISFMLNTMIFHVVPTIFEIGLVSAILWSTFGLQYSVITTGTVVAYCAFTVATTEWRTKFRKDMNKFDNQANSKVVDSLMNYETVKYFNNEHLEQKEHEKILQKYQHNAEMTQYSLSVLNFGQNFIFSVGLTAMMCLASQGILTGALTIGDLVMINSLLFQLTIPLNFIGGFYSSIRQALIDLEAMMTLTRIQPKIREPQNPIPLELHDCGGEICFQNVSFGYHEDQKIVDGLSFTVPEGKTCAIVGTSGCGKSTLIRLLYRFYDPSAGSITINGTDIQKCSLHELRGSIGVVPQDIVLFNTTLHENIKYGNPENTTEEELNEVLQITRLSDTIERLPNGLSTIVGERGLMLSGGEKQRVSIARMLLKKPKFIICDEATSNLDAITEHELLDSIQSHFKGRTCLFIAHRLSTIRDADKIVVLDEGRLVEEGTHEELIGKQGLYADLWNIQIQQMEETG